MQKLGGTPQMWTLLSFTGRFDVAFLENAIARSAKGRPRMPGERTEQQRQQIRDAQMGRARLRRGAMLQRLAAAWLGVAVVLAGCSSALLQRWAAAERRVAAVLSGSSSALL